MMNWYKNKNSWLFAMLLLAAPAYAFQAEEKLADPIKENQAEQIFKDVRCVVCEGESLAESSADMAYDMRALIRKEINQGQTPEQIKATLVANYGQQILQTPPMGVNTYFLWFAPFFMLVVGVVLLIIKRKKPEGKS